MTAPDETFAVHDETNTAATSYVDKRRQRRQRRGLFSLVACVVLITGFLFGLKSADAYSHFYYICYFVSFGSFALMLPSALPTDNTKIRRVLYATAWCSFCVLLTALVFARRRWLAYMDNSCTEQLHVQDWYCIWNVAFWLLVCPPSIILCATMVKAARAPPIAGLNCFWKSAGIYLIALGTHNSIDQVLAIKAGLFDTTGLTKLAWRAVISVEVLTFGVLCSSNQFKLQTWKVVASIASIRTIATVRDEAASTDPACCSELPPPTCLDLRSDTLPCSRRHSPSRVTHAHGRRSISLSS